MQANAITDTTVSLPHDIEVEKGLLSCFLDQPDQWLNDARLSIPEDAFYNGGLRTLFQFIKECHDASLPLDNISLTVALRKRGMLDDVGAPAILSELRNFVPTPAHYPHFKKILLAQHARRRLILELMASLEEAKSPLEDVTTTATRIRERVTPLMVPYDGPSSTGRSFVELLNTPPDPAKTLLGERFLCIGGTLVIVAPSGIGKSTLSIQMAANFALGQGAFAITPARPIKILIIQAENDDGDAHEMIKGTCQHFRFGAEELSAIAERTRYVTAKHERGETFLALLDMELRTFRPDIVVIDPLHSFAGCKIEEAKEIGAFLRAGLNPLLERYQCAAIIIHHTPKPKQDDGKDRTAMDFLYAGAGSAEITNHARAVLAIEMKTPGVFAFHAAKRGGRIGWRSASGPFDNDEDTWERVQTKYFRHAREPGAMHWEAITDPEEVEAAAKSRGGKNPEAALLAEIPVVSPIEKDLLITKANEKSGIGLTKLKTALKLMLQADDPKVFEWREKRARTNDLVRIWTSPQTPRA